MTDVHRRRFVSLPQLALAIAVVWAGLTTASAQPLCVTQQSFPPIGASGDPGETLRPEEHHLMHSCTHLQGALASEKVAPAIHLPGPTSSLSEMRTIVVVDNPSPNQVLNVDIEYYNPAGVLVGTSPVTIAAEGHYQEVATPLAGFPWGTVRVLKQSKTDPDFVGATLFHTYAIGVANNPGLSSEVPSAGEPGEPGEPGGEPGGELYEFFRETHLTRVGAASMQQLQAQQDNANQLFWGPLPLTNDPTLPLSWDFIRGNSPLLMVTNPTPNPITINVFITTNTGVPLATYPVNLNGFASWVDMTFFDFWVASHTAAVPYDVDALVLVTSPDPIIGQGVMFDFYGPGMAFMDRFRMASTMMSNTSVETMSSPELISEVSPIATNTLLGIANTTVNDIGPIDIEYRDRMGNIVGVDTIANFPFLSTLRIGPNGPLTPNYPLNEFAGSVIIRSCLPGLTGWSVRATEHAGPPGPTLPPFDQTDGNVTFELRKAWGEVLDGGNGAEPGPGYGDDSSDILRRKLGPLNLVSNDPDVPGSVPGYNQILNDGSSNAGFNFYQIFDEVGLDFTSFAFQPFPGLAFGFTSFTYLDNTVPLVTPVTSRFVTTKFNHETQRVSGVNALGGYTYDWPWEQDPLIPPPQGTYAGPGDVVPPL